MPYLPNFRNDIFVSYAHADNEDGPSGVRWVSEFTKYLGTGLKQRLGCGNALRIYFDHRDLYANHELEGLLDEVQNSAIFLAVTSPSYMRRKWTRREIEAFTSLPNFQKRLFAIEISPLDSHDDYLAPLKSKPRKRFWQRSSPESRTPFPLDPQLHPQMYTQVLLDFTEQVRLQLLTMQEQPGGASVRASTDVNAAKTGSHKGKVLLAQTTDELEFEREQVKSYLSQMNVRVLPETDYPQGGQQFKQRFTDDLAKVDLFVQLLGRAAGRKPPDLPEGYVQTQFSLATKARKPMLLWRHPELDAENIPDPVQRELLTADSVVASGLESFKSEIVRSLEALAAPRPKTTPSLVYIGAERVDLPVARELAETLKTQEYPVVLPTFEGSSEEIRKDLEENLMESDTVVFIHGSAPSTWIRGNLRRLHKLMSLREKPPRKVAVLTAPPPKDSEINVSLPYVQTIDRSSGLDPGSIIPLLEKPS